MYLKKLKLYGFKSFLRPTTIVFDPDLSVIIGPNGSGKSNIVDAVVWVLGEQNPRFLRGYSMLDVVFAGSKRLKKAPFAEVSLIFDNTDGRLPVDTSEVSIKRRVTRDGDSSYFINEKPCRLLDIRELIAHTGMGVELPGIIPQNKLHELIMPNASDLKSIVEEASGIAGHKRKKDAAVKKLVSVEQKIEKIKAMKEEAERELKPLERQVNQMKRVKKTKQEYKSFWLRLKIQELKELKKRWEEIEEEIVIVDSSLEKIKSEKEDFELRRNKLSSLFESQKVETENVEISNRLNEIIGKINILSSVAEEKGKNIIENISRSRKEIFSLNRRIKNLENNLELLYQDLESAEKDFHLYKREINNAKSILKEENYEVNLKKKDSLESEYSKLVKKFENLKEINIEKEVNIKSLKTNISNIENEIPELQSKYEKLITKAKEKNKKINSIKPGLEEKEKKLLDIDSEIDELEREISKINNNLFDKNQQINSLENEIKHLKKKVKSYYSNQSKTLFERIVVKPENSGIIESILGDFLKAKIINRKNALKEIRNSDRETYVLDISSGSKFELDNNRHYFIDNFHDIPLPVKILLSNYLIEDSIESAVKKFEISERKGYVTKDGYLITPEGMIRKNSSKLSPMVLRNNLKSLKKKQKKLRKQSDSLKEKYEGLLSKLNNIKAEKEKLKKSVKEKKVQLGKLKDKNHELKTALQMMEKEINEKKLNKRHFEEQLEKELKEKEEVDTKLNDLNELLDNCRTDLSNTRRELDKNLSSRQNIQNKIDNYTSLKKELEKRINLIKKEINQKEEEKGSIRENLSALNEISERTDYIRKKITVLYQLYEDFLEEAGDLHRRYSIPKKAQEKLLEYKSEIDKLIDLSNQLTKKEQKYLSRKEILNSQKESTEEKLKELTEQIEKRTQKSIDSLLDDFPKEKLSKRQLKDRVSRLNSLLETSGKYNPFAERDYVRVNERVQFLKNQLTDIFTASENIKQIIDEVEKKMKDRFIDSLEKLDNSFNGNFKHLFGGGKASLSLSNPDEPLNSGIDIFVRPPEKKLKRISLLSGGEKSLAAISLVFAIDEVFDIPFLLLDEVEPALDELNLKRFVEKLKEVSKRSQVIMISHQSLTIEYAKSVYGVTMTRDGASKIYSLKI